ncbi:MAG TPA: response regulator [Vicinamibacteria bacterium]|nr:response regulator [Vicinamibacteria bacterium]
MNRILIVEDNRRIREGLQALVENAGFRTASAGDYRGAAELLLTERFDLLITDLDLPGGTGLDLVHYARAVSPKIATILVTAFGCSEIRKQVQELELAGYFEKPYDPAVLMERIRSSLGARKRISARSVRSD